MLTTRAPLRVFLAGAGTDPPSYYRSADPEHGESRKAVG